MWKNRIYTTWADNRAGETGYDIWLNVLDFNDPSLRVNPKRVSQIPENFILSQNYPNPFNCQTIIQYELLQPAVITIYIYDLLGQLVAKLAENLREETGRHSINFNASNLSAGIYLYRIDAYFPNGKHLTEVKKIAYSK